MRIIDLSSDVCSSDLMLRQPLRFLRGSHLGNWVFHALSRRTGCFGNFQYAKNQHVLFRESALGRSKQKLEIIILMMTLVGAFVVSDAIFIKSICIRKLGRAPV